MLALRVKHEVRVLRDPLAFRNPVSYFLLIPIHTRFTFYDGLFRNCDGYLRVDLTRVREVWQEGVVWILERGR